MFSVQAYRKWRNTYDEEDKLPGLGFNNDQLFFISFAQVRDLSTAISVAKGGWGASGTVAPTCFRPD